MDRAGLWLGFVGIDDVHRASHASDDGAIRMTQYSYTSQRSVVQYDGEAHE